VLDDSSRGVFQGKVLVREGAQGTDGQQHHKALLLSDKAEVDAKPELEIYADDVQCAHGATVGAIDVDQLFYLRARGISEPEARAMLMQSFLMEAVEKIARPAIRDAFVDLLSARLNGVDR
jgi:Fe-S cluster assembly protein SufD